MKFPRLIYSSSSFIFCFLLTLMVTHGIFPAKIYAATPQVFVQIHTWWNSPSSVGTHRDPNNPYDSWGYWGIYPNIKPDTFYSNSAWKRRIIPSLKYPIAYNNNVTGQAVQFSLNDVFNVANAGSYPAIGVYDSTADDIIRYQIRLAKNAGVTAFAVSVYDIYTDDYLNVCPQSHVPYSVDGLDRFLQFLNIAQQENFKIFAEVWIPFQPSSNDPNICGSVASWIRAVKRIVSNTANYPAYYKINGLPLVSFGSFAGVDQALKEVKLQSGNNIYWLGRALSSEFEQNQIVNAITVGSVLKAGMFIENPDYQFQINEIQRVKNSVRKPVAAHIYPGFDDTFRRFVDYYINSGYVPMGMARIDGSGNNVFQKQLVNSISAGADFLWIESWNDYQEQTEIEPARVVNGEERQDVFRDLRTLAAALGIVFTEPSRPSSIANCQSECPSFLFIPGDLDKNGKIDIFDYNTMLQNFGKKDCGNVADIDGNCKVDIFDYNILVGNFGK